MKKGLTKLELERQKKKELFETESILEATGSESETKAKKWVREVAREEEKKQKQLETRQLESLDYSKKKVTEYRQQLLQLLHDFILELRLPKSFSWGVWFDGVGVRLALSTPDKKYHQRAFTPSYSPVYDLNACYLFYYWVEKLYSDYQQKETKWSPKSTSKR